MINHFAYGRAAALFLSTALSTAALVAPAHAQTARELTRARDAYISSGYNYCDAKLLGAQWGQSVDRGKIEIGLKFLGGYPENIPPVLAESRAAGHRCTFDDTGLGLDDAERLAAVWGSGVTAAKARAAQLYTAGRSQEVTNDLTG